MTPDLELGGTLIDEAEKARHQYLAHLHATNATWLAFCTEVTRLARHLCIASTPPHIQSGVHIGDNRIVVADMSYHKYAPGTVLCTHDAAGSEAYVAADVALTDIAKEMGRLAAQREFETTQKVPV